VASAAAAGAVFTVAQPEHNERAAALPAALRHYTPKFKVTPA